MQKLFNDLNIKAIVIIEDETTAYNFNQYLSWLLSPKSNLNSLIEVEELVEKSKKFLSQLKDSSHYTEVKKQINFDTPYTDFIKSLSQSLQNILTELQKHYSQLNEKILFWNKLANLDSNYENILQILEETDVPIHYMNNFYYSEEDIQQLADRLNDYDINSRILYIVDKTFNGEEKGYDIINNLLTEIPKKHNLPLPLSVIFTSNIRDQKINWDRSKKDYFKHEISKNTSQDEVINLITNISKSCEYVHTISNLSLENKKSIEKAEKEILNSQALFSKIIQTAHNEGVSPYEVINDWLVLSQNYFFSHSMADKLGSIFGSSKVFLDYTPLHVNDTNIHQMHLINSFEIFDPHVNKKHLPISPGDIFQSNDKYYVLVGQACDTSCRSNSTRKTNVAELLEASITTKKYSDKAQMISENDGTSVIFRHFPIGNETKQLKIDVNKIRTCPFDLLDLAVYNTDGKCNIDTGETLNSLANNILPKGQKDKYYLLQQSLRNLFSQHSILSPLKDELFQHLTFHFLSPTLHFEKYDANGIDNFKIDTKLKRLVRLKGNFNYFLNKARHDYIGRVDLNGIHFNSEHVTFTVTCKYHGSSTANINAWYDRNKKGWIFNKDDLKESFTNVPHFDNINGNYFIVKESGKKDTHTKIQYDLENDTIILDCPITVQYTTTKDYLYSGKRRFKLSEIIKPFSNIKCHKDAICKDATSLLNKAIKLSEMQNKEISEFNVKLNFNEEDAILRIEDL